jgi:hypothetical protein
MKKKCAAVVATKPNQSSPERTEQILFKQTKQADFENWMQMPFFAQIAKDQKEQSQQMSRKFNLNFESPDHLFKQTPDSI